MGGWWWWFAFGIAMAKIQLAQVLIRYTETYACIVVIDWRKDSSKFSLRRINQIVGSIS